MSPNSCTSGIAAAFNSVGLPVHSVIDRRALEELARVTDAVTVDRYGLLRSSGAVVVAFPYDPRSRDDGAAFDRLACNPKTFNPAFVRIGAFAAWNRYAALSRLLLGAGRLLAVESGFPVKSFRAIVNSRLPEKRFAVMAGLGFIGRSSLVITEAYGPSCLLGALLLPLDFPLPEDMTSWERVRIETALVPGSGCGSCMACVEACPGSAIASHDMGIQLERCIQYWTAKAGTVPEQTQAVWGQRLYGCDVCVATCPRSTRAWSVDARGTSPAERAEGLFLPAEKRPGPLVPVQLLETASDDELKAFFRKTSLGLSWIGLGELRRNVCISKACRNVGI